MIRIRLVVVLFSTVYPVLQATESISIDTNLCADNYLSICFSYFV